PLEGEHDVARLELAPVVELHPRPERERPDPRLGVGAPPGRQHRLDLEALVDPGQVVVDVLGDHVLVALDREGGVDRPRRAGPGHLQGAAGPRRLRPRPLPAGAERQGDPDRARCRGQLEELPPRQSGLGPLRARAVTPHPRSPFPRSRVLSAHVAVRPPSRSITANASISTSSSGSASPCTTTPVLQWCTPSKYRSIIPYTAGRYATSVT